MECINRKILNAYAPDVMSMAFLLNYSSKNNEYQQKKLAELYQEASDCLEKYRQKVTEQEGKQMDKIKTHADICKELTDLYERKNSDYGDSFAELREEFPNAICIRLTDKLNRLKRIYDPKYSSKVTDETVEDTLKDIANYAILELIERKNENESVSIDVNGNITKFIHHGSDFHCMETEECEISELYVHVTDYDGDKCTVIFCVLCPDCAGYSECVYRDIQIEKITYSFLKNGINSMLEDACVLEKFDDVIGYEEVDSLAIDIFHEIKDFYAHGNNYKVVYSFKKTYKREN